MSTVFLRVLEADDKAMALLEAVHGRECDARPSRGWQRFDVDPANFAIVPRSPFAYWVTPSVLRCFKRFPSFETRGRIARITNPVADNFRFVRAWWEPAYSRRPSRHAWVPLCKGGAFSPFYYDPHLLVSWSLDRNTYLGFVGTEHRPLEKPACLEHFFKPGITWPVRTSGLSFRIMPAGCVFSSKGPAAFDSDGLQSTLSLCGLLNSSAFAALVALQLARTELAQSYEVGLIQTTPVPMLTDSDHNAIAAIVRRAWSLRRSLDTCAQTSHVFELPALLQVAGDDLAARVAKWVDHARTVESELTAIQHEIDERCFALYGIDDADRRTIAAGLHAQDSEAGGVDADDDEETVEAGDTAGLSADGRGLVEELVSWSVGVAFGRFDVRVATGARLLPSEPEPFDPLPPCSPGMLASDDGLPLAKPPPGYPLAFPESGVLVDDPGHPHDLVTAVRVVFDVVFGVDADRWWNIASVVLDPKDHELRCWLARSFFESHLKRYSKSRRKAPILWQLSIPSGRYSVWLYAHLLTRDSIFQLQNDVVSPKLIHEERQLISLVQNARERPSASERKNISSQETIVAELRVMLDELKRLAPLWNLNLDDGVVLTMAPLWRLVAHHDPWKKELKSKWNELVAGEYDWAHVAMHLWPERVVPKCAVDRSLAIAHGLEDVFWVEADVGRWKPRPSPKQQIADLVRERTSVAGKAALKALTEAPAPSGQKLKARR